LYLQGYPFQDCTGYITFRGTQAEIIDDPFGFLADL
jgi:hypothetical protein